MSVPKNPELTELHKPQPKIFGNRSAGLPSRDLTDPDQVFVLALEAMRATPRRLMQLSLDEQRAIAQLAVQAGIIASRFLQVIALSDANAPRSELIAALAKAAEIGRATAKHAGACSQT